MKHDENLLLSAYLDGELSAPEIKRLDAHLPRCVECRVELESLRRVKAGMAGLERRAAPADLVVELEERFGARTAPQRAGFGRRVYWTAGAAAALLTAAAFWMTRLKAQERYIPLEPLVAAHARYRARTPLNHFRNLIASADSFQSAADYVPSTDEK